MKDKVEEVNKGWAINSSADGGRFYSEYKWRPLKDFKESDM